MISASALTWRGRDGRCVREATVDAVPGDLLVVGGHDPNAIALLRLLATLMQPDSGRLTIAGVDALARPLDARRAIGFASCDSPFPPALTVGEYLDFLPRCRGRAAASANLLERFGLERDRRIDQLLPGPRQLVRLAGVAAVAPAVVLLDRPLESLGSREAALALRWIDESRRSAVVIVTDVPARIGITARRDLVIAADGQLAATVNPGVLEALA